MSACWWDSFNESFWFSEESAREAERHDNPVVMLPHGQRTVANLVNSERELAMYKREFNMALSRLAKGTARNTLSKITATVEKECARDLLPFGGSRFRMLPSSFLQRMWDLDARLKKDAPDVVDAQRWRTLLAMVQRGEVQMRHAFDDPATMLTAGGIVEMTDQERLR